MSNVFYDIKLYTNCNLSIQINLPFGVLKTRSMGAYPTEDSNSVINCIKKTTNLLLRMNILQTHKIKNNLTL